jgi:tetratricopeptide (TPR) repeat protein
MAQEVIHDLERLMADCRHGGPPPEDEQTLWFQSTMAFVQSTFPLDQLNAHSTTQGIQDAVLRTVEAILQDRGLNTMRSNPGSVLYLGALAVDAWIANDMPWIQKFLIKRTLLEKLQTEGLTAILTDARAGRPTALTAEMEGVLKQQESSIKRALEHRGGRACHCLTLATQLNLEREVLLNPNDEDAKARRRQREIEQLPSLLKPNSKFCNTKKKAASHLGAGRLKQSIELYEQALEMIQKELKIKVETADIEWNRKMGDESGKIESNLSFLFLQQNMPDKACLHADRGIANFPRWSKPHCRRALALEALMCFEEADAAIDRALEICEREISEGEASAKERTEYQKIQHRIEAGLKDQEQVTSEVAQTVRTSEIQPNETNVGSLSCFFHGMGIFDKVMTFLTTKDVASLERTCQVLAANPEQRRRLAFSGPLWNVRTDQVEQCIRVYCNQKLNDPTSALSELIVSALALLPQSHGRDLPRWLRSMLQQASVTSRNTIMSACVGHNHLHDAMLFSSDVCACRWLLRMENVSLSTKEQALTQIGFDFSDEDDLSDEDRIRDVYRYDIDGELMRLTLSLASSGDDLNAFQIRDMAFGALHNLILNEGGRLQQLHRNIGLDSPLVTHARSLASTVAKYFPSSWPCEKTWERNWNYTEEDIDGYWTSSNPKVFRRWKAALSEAFKWLRQAENCDHQYILLNQFSLLQQFATQAGSVTVNAFSLGTFLMKIALEHGGTSALTRTLVSQRDYAKLTSNFYSMVRLYMDFFPEVIDWRNRALAQERMLR